MIILLSGLFLTQLDSSNHINHIRDLNIGAHSFEGRILYVIFEIVLHLRGVAINHLMPTVSVAESSYHREL